MNHEMWRLLRRFFASRSWTLPLALLFPLAACNTVFDEIHGAANAHQFGVPECDVDYEKIPLGGLGPALAARHVGCMAALFRRYLAEEFPRDTTPERLQAWLERRGFRCDSRSLPTGDTGRECSMRRVSQKQRLFGAGIEQEHAWLVAMKNVAPVLPTVRVQVTYPE